jgi:hypothetical protein
MSKYAKDRMCNRKNIQVCDQIKFSNNSNNSNNKKSSLKRTESKMDENQQDWNRKWNRWFTVAA